MSWLTLLLIILHVLAGAAWFGSMVYSLFVMQPRASAYFGSAERFEPFIAFVSHGARRSVFGAFGLMAVSGLGLTWLKLPSPPSPLWLALFALKIGLYLIALGLFAYTTWQLWPLRVLASADEAPAMQRTFRFVGWTMIALVGAMMILGIVMRIA